ncbi:MAG: Polar-differentiation response regulator DivK [Chlamydiae bacterium]|nr:Polar-differentiation response regulator DivK [Chlamydiota bacterium]
MSDTEKPNILIVDDNPANLIAMRILLKVLDVNIIKASSGKEALAYLPQYNFAAILMDVRMPEMDGYETAEHIHQNEEFKNIPIIFVTAIDEDEQEKYKFNENVVVEYIYKPLDPDILIKRVNVIIQPRKRS